MEVRSVLIETILSLLIVTVHGYNLDIDFPIIYSYEDIVSDAHPSPVNSYFGYTVQLYHERTQNLSWVIVGAPKGNYSSTWRHGLKNTIEPGTVYRCTMQKACQEFKRHVKSDKGTLKQMQISMHIHHQQRGWFGGALSVDRLNGILAVCAPRTIINVKSKYEEESHTTMHGVCYSGNLSSNTLSIEDEVLQFYNFSSKFWYNPVHGFSVHYATPKGNDEEVRRIIGEPKHESYGSVEIESFNKRITVELPMSDDLSQFGYSVESGYFFNKNTLLYVSGAPGWQYVGQVALINPNVSPLIVGRIHGTNTGEYFGASLAVGDLNNDGLDDLVIGAPHWGQDNGRAYVYFGSWKKKLEAAAILQGTSEGSQFGHTIACGDLDADGFDDIIVGSPWEENGVIYVYNGGRDFKDNNLKASERIEVLKEPKIKTFGFSISKPVDIDSNGYSDIAVGAYKSGHVIIFRSKPVVKTQLAIQAVPDTLQRDAKQFLIKACSRYNRYNTKIISEFKITLTIDERFQRTKETFLELQSSNLTSDTCLTARVNISKNVLDFVEPISIFAKHEFVYKNTSSFCKFCTVERKNNELTTAKIMVPFNIGCGEDKICNSNLTATVQFHGVRDNNTWVIGSTDVISLQIRLKNYGEPAYLTTLEFTFPEGVVLRSILPFCQEDTSKENLVIVCDAGNPVWEKDEKSIKLDLDMKHLIHVSLHDHELNFDISIKTRSMNHGMTNIKKMLNLVNEVSLSLNGKAIEETYYLSNANDDATNISFQHVYQVYKLGETPIEDAQLIIKVPMIIKGSKPLINVYKPQLYVSGEVYECFSNSVLLGTPATEIPKQPSLRQFNMNLFPTEIEQTENHLIYERHLKESDIEFYDTVNSVPEVVRDNLTFHFSYTNCSNLDIDCATIVCNLSALKTLQDIGKVVMKFVLDSVQLKDILTNDRVALKFATEATVKIIKPAVRVSVNKTRSAMEIVTIFYKNSKVEQLQLWIVVVSVSIGLLLLLISVVILSKFGFFKRKNKQDITSQTAN